MPNANDARLLRALGRQLEAEPTAAELDRMSAQDLVRAAFGDSPIRRNAQRRRLLAQVNAEHQATVEAALGIHEDDA